MGSASAPTRKRSPTGRPSACPTSGSCCARARRISGRRDPPAHAALARSSTSTAASRLTPLPANNIDTGLGLNRLAAILQDKPSVFETDQFWPLIELGEQLSGARYGESFPADRSLRILGDHAREMTFL